MIETKTNKPLLAAKVQATTHKISSRMRESMPPRCRDWRHSQGQLSSQETKVGARQGLAFTKSFIQGSPNIIFVISIKSQKQCNERNDADKTSLEWMPSTPLQWWATGLEHVSIVSISHGICNRTS